MVQPAPVVNICHTRSIMRLSVLIGLVQLAQLTSLAYGVAARGQHTYSTFTTSLKRQSVPLIGRRSSETRNIIDNLRVKYVVPITVGGQTLNAEIDTGSSDTWFVQTGYQCYHTFENSSQTVITTLNSTACNFGPTFTLGTDFVPDDDIHQFTCYGSGAGTRRCVFGPLGYTNITINGFTAPHQLIGAVNQVSVRVMESPPKSHS